MDFNAAQSLKKELDAACTSASQKLNEFKSLGNSSMGLTPDHVKVMPEYQEAKKEYDIAFKKLREFNAYYVKTFKKELSLQRKQKV